MRRDNYDSRRNLSAFKKLIAAPATLASGGFKLPASGELFVSTTSALGSPTSLVDCAGRAISSPAGPANRKAPLGWLERGKRVAAHAGAPGTLSLYVRTGLGKFYKIGG